MGWRFAAAAVGGPWWRRALLGLGASFGRLVVKARDTLSAPTRTQRRGPMEATRPSEADGFERHLRRLHPRPDRRTPPPTPWRTSRCWPASSSSGSPSPDSSLSWCPPVVTPVFIHGHGFPTSAREHPCRSVHCRHQLCLLDRQCAAGRGAVEGWHLFWRGRLVPVRRPHQSYPLLLGIPPLLRHAADAADARHLLGGDVCGRTCHRETLKAAGLVPRTHPSQVGAGHVLLGLHDLSEHRLSRPCSHWVLLGVPQRARFGGGGGYALDPVCGMQVETASAPGTLHSRGARVFYFCSDHCKMRFDAEPSRFSEKADKADGCAAHATRR